MYLCCSNFNAIPMPFDGEKQSPALVLIVALARDNAIGKNNQLLCHLPEDLTYFKKTTMGGTLLMGRKTFASIGRPLPGRKTVVVSTQDALLLPEGVEVVHSVADVLALLQHTEKLFVAGGVQIYKLLFPYVSECLITRIDATFDADAYFPCELLPSEWELASASEWQTSANGIRYRFERYLRK